jgi:LPXTG-motif cell wall-anchored protein
VETADGHTATVNVRKLRDGQNVTIPPGGTATANITDTYDVGSLIVNKTITGQGAGHQSAVTISVTCGGTPLTPVLTVPAGSAAGTYSQAYTGILAGTSCTATETANGVNSTVTVTTAGSPQTITIGAGGTGTADITDTYDLVPGNLTVTKTIAGDGAGLQGAVTIEVTCDGTLLTPVFTIPAGTPAGSTSHTYTGIPAGAVCSVVETADGHTATVRVSKPRSGENIVIPPGGTATTTITDTYDVGALVVNKTITGRGAGHQGAVTITVVCGETTLPAFTIPAGTAAGTVTKEYPGILAGTTCTVTETANGASATVTVVTEGSPQDVAIGPNGATANLTDTYAQVPGTLIVTKTISGPAAGQQGPIAILIDCGGPPNVHAFLLPPATPGGPVPRVIAEVPAGSTCVVTEVIKGNTGTVSGIVVGSGQRVVVGAGATVNVNLEDTFSILATTTTTPTTAPTVAPTTAPATLPNTGAGDGSTGLATGALLAGAVGALLVLVSRRRAAKSS